VLDITAASMPGSVTNAKLWIGNDNDAEFLNGRAAAIKLYDAVLTPAEIVQEMRQYLPARTANNNGWYPLFTTNDDQTDFSGLGRDWTVGGTLATEDGPPIPWKSGQSKIYLPLSAAPPASGNRRRRFLMRAA
jgi:hypothetical protein